MLTYAHAIACHPTLATSGGSAEPRLRSARLTKFLRERGYKVKQARAFRSLEPQVSRTNTE
jgi:hypothetical protein